MSRKNVLKWVLYSVIVFLLAILQLQISCLPRFFNVTPIFLIPAVISTAMLEDETAGGIFGVASGLIWDCATGHLFGFNAFFLMVMGIAAGLFVRLLLRKSAFSAVLIVSVFTFVHEFLTWFFFWYMKGMNNLGYAMVHIILTTVLMTVVFTIPIYLLFKVVYKKAAPQETDLSE